MKQNDILYYIDRFTGRGRREGVFECFEECSARFALDLCQRFYPGELMYSAEENLFGARIDGLVYNIHGDVTDYYNWETWSSFANREPVLSEEVYHNSILMEPISWRWRN